MDQTSARGGVGRAASFQPDIGKGGERRAASFRPNNDKGGVGG
jgi:hypothetical protein